MAPELDPQKRVGRKLVKRRKPLRASSVQYPARLAEGEDVQEDVTAVQGKPAQYMDQSVFSMIAAAGSKSDFHARFEGEGSDSEEDQDALPLIPTFEAHVTFSPSEKRLVKERAIITGSMPLREQRSGRSEHKGTHALPSVRLRTDEKRCHTAQNDLLPSKESSSIQEPPKDITPCNAPMTSKILEAEAELSSSTESPEIMGGELKDSRMANSKEARVSLATRLMEIFEFKEPEEIISGLSD